jgi:hypothetical protein
MDLKAWIEVLLATVIGGTTLYIAWKQYALEQRREAERRWERRLAVCEDVYRFLDSTSQAGLPQPEPLAALMRATEPMNLSFLFTERHDRYLTEIRQRAHQLWVVAAQERDTPEGPRRELTTKRLELIDWMEARRAEFKPRFQAQLAMIPKSAWRRRTPKASPSSPRRPER